MWEDAFFTKLTFNNLVMDFDNDVEEVHLTLRKQTSDLLDKLEDATSPWADEMTKSQKGGIAIVGLYLELGVGWDGKSDMLLARLVALLVGDELKAHADAVVHYVNGAWVPQKTLPEHCTILIEEAMAAARYLFKVLQDNMVRRCWNDVFYFLEDPLGIELPPGANPLWNEYAPVEDFELSQNHWASVAGLCLKHVPWRVSPLSTKSGGGLDCYADFYQVERVEEHTRMNFINAQLQYDKDGDSGNHLKTIKKDKSNSCYMSVDINIAKADAVEADDDVGLAVPELGFKAPEHLRLRMRRGIIAAFAGNPEGMKQTVANDCLGVMKLQTTDVCNIHKGSGGNSKSLLAELRHNAYGGTHRYVSPAVMESEEEWRKQAIHFAHAHGITMEEVAIAAWLRPDILKTWWAGGFLPARPNYGKETQMLRWQGTAFNWNCNEAPRMKIKDPSDPKSRESLERRVNIIEYFATFVSDPQKVDMEKMIFLDDPDIKEFWTSGMGRFIVWHDIWMPFMQHVSLADARKILTNPSDHQKRLRSAFVKDMVGLDEVVEDEKSHDDLGKSSRTLLEKVHSETQSTENFVKLYRLKSMKCIPGSAQDYGTEAKPARLDNMKAAVDKFPFLFKFQFQTSGYLRANFNPIKFTTCATKHEIKDYDTFPTCFQSKADLQEAKDFDENFVKDDPDLEKRTGVCVGTQMADDDVKVTLTEVVVNLAKLKAHASNAHLEKAEKALIKKYISRLNSQGCSCGKSWKRIVVSVLTCYVMFVDALCYIQVMSYLQ